MTDFCLANFSKKDWTEAADYIQSRMSDDVIGEAVKNMPPEAYALSGTELETKLKQRTKDLQGYAEEYYLMLSKQVDVIGSNKREHFTAVRNSNGTISVTVLNIKKDGTLGRKLFERTFDSKETKELRLYGLDGEDVFNISGETKNSIRIRVIGGPAPDEINDKSQVSALGKKTLVYEEENESKIQLGSEGKLVNHWDKTVYNYDRTRFAYNRYMPTAFIGSNSTNGFGGSVGITFTQQKFGKEDYSARHSIKGSFTTENMNIFEYNGRFHHVFGKWDVEIGGLIADNNEFNKFFGIGNGTVNVDALDDANFYQARYETYSGKVGVARDFWKKSIFRLGVAIENNESVIDPGSILEFIDSLNFDLSGLREARIAEAVAELDLDLRDRNSFPEQGMRLYLKHQSGIITNDDNAGYGVTQASIEKYATLRMKNPWTLGLRFGGSKSYGENEIPFYKMSYLGQQNNLRGYEKNRFTGTSSIYFNSELRVQLTEFETPIIPLKFGLKGFFDVGRVYSDFDTDNDLHSGYGFGVYFVPVKESFAINISAGFSDEESGLLLITIGGAIN